MNTKYQIISVLAISIFLWFGEGLSIHAQTAIDGRLVYAKGRDKIHEYVNLSATEIQIYPVQPDMCVGIAKDGRYILQTSEIRSDLIIRSFDTGEILLTSEWQPEWETCGAIYFDDEQFIIRRQGKTDEFFYFDFSSGQLSSIPRLTQPVSTTAFLALPNWQADSENNYVLQSPEQGIYLYQRCDEVAIIRTSEVCSDISFVIYDLTRQEVVKVLEDASPLIVPSTQYPYESTGGASWSATGRYLAFASFARGNMQVYDLENARYLDAIFPFDSPIEWRKPLIWSPQSDRLAVWVYGTPGKDIVSEPSDRSLVFYNAGTQRFTLTDTIYQVPDIRELGVWSPNGETFAFVDVLGQLVLVNTGTGHSSVLDTDVNRIIAWREE